MASNLVAASLVAANLVAKPSSDDAHGKAVLLRLKSPIKLALTTLSSKQEADR